MRSEPNVNEELALEPLTDYSKFKLLCERLLASENLGDMEYVILRPATVCGYAPRLRLGIAVFVVGLR